MNLPSGNGQNTKDKSMSIVHATDDPALELLQAIAVAIGVSDDSDAGQATAARQDTGNASATSIDAKLGSTAVAAAADGESNATTMGTLRARLMAYGGASWAMVRAGITTVGNAVTGFANEIPWAFFNTTPTTRTTGQGGPLEADANGSLRVAEQAPPAYENVSDAVASVHDKPAASAANNAIPYDIIAKSTAGVIKAAPGNLYRMYVTNSNVAAQAYALVNKATTPATGDTPVMYFMVGINETKLIEFKYGKRFTTGIGWAQCTVFGAATITTTTADSLVDAECS